MRVSQRELMAPFPALKLPLIIMGGGVRPGPGQQQDQSREEKRDRPEHAGRPCSGSRMATGAETGTGDPRRLPATQGSGVPTESPPHPHPAGYRLGGDLSPSLNSCL